MKKECKTIAHAIISAVRPRSFLSPLHITLTNVSQEIWLQKVINICHSLGFCASYKEATLYEASTTFATPPEIKPGSFAQFVHDNADFNINTMKFHDLHKSGEVFKNVNEDSNNIF
ncbi:hypothetical protein TNCV_2369381 [Trichonephila clavipes]|nr:hypothetical protein TNCV_2369381 [Trichonephila clavipes]